MTLRLLGCARVFSCETARMADGGSPVISKRKELPLILSSFLSYQLFCYLQYCISSSPLLTTHIDKRQVIRTVEGHVLNADAHHPLCPLFL